MTHLQHYARVVTRRFLIAFSIAALGACSEDTSSSRTNESGAGGSRTANESGGTSASTGGVGRGSTTSATGSVTNASGGNTTTSSSATPASGGVAGETQATGGTMSATGGTRAAAGGTTAGLGGKTGGSGGRSAGASGGATSGVSAIGGASASAGASSTGGSRSPTGGAGGANSSIGGSAAGGGSGGGGGAATGGTSTGENRSPGCGTTISRPNPRTQQTMDIGGATRYYLLDVPSSADNQTPLMLIFGLHGYDMNNVAVIDRYNFNSRSGGKAITVLPQGEGPPPGDVSHWGDQVLKSTWNGNEANYNFIHTLMTDLENRYCIDKNRVFIAGFSMGGFFTNALACVHSDWFRAFAPISGGVAGTSCANASVKPPIMIHHGTADKIVEFSSGEATRDYWTKQNGCSQTSKSSYTGCESYDGCAQPVIFCIGSWEHDITGTAAGNIWSFFNGFK